MKRHWVWVAAALLLAACQTTQQAAVESRPGVLIASSIYPLSNPRTAALRYMGERLEAESGGRLRIELHHSMELGGSKENLRAAQAGRVAITEIEAPILGGVSTSFRVFTLPYLFRDRSQMFTVLDGPIGDEILATLDGAKLVGLGFFDGGTWSIFTRGGPVRSPGDLKGKRIRTMDNAVSQAFMAAMGAQGVPLSPGKVRPGLSDGSLDGSAQTPHTYRLFRFYEDAPFLSLTEHMRVPAVLMFSRKVWDRLSPADRDLVRRVAREAVEKERVLWAEREAGELASLAHQGVKIVRDVDRDAFVAATRGIRERTAADFGVAGLLHRIQ